MMRYLGLGVGHMQPADFPREHDCLKKVPFGDEYQYTEWEEGNTTHSLSHLDEDEDEEEDEEWDPDSLDLDSNLEGEGEEELSRNVEYEYEW